MYFLVKKGAILRFFIKCWSEFAPFRNFTSFGVILVVQYIGSYSSYRGARGNFEPVSVGSSL